MHQSSAKVIKLFVAESAELYRVLFEMIPQRGPVDIVGFSDSYNIPDISDLTPSACPDVLLLGARTINKNIAEKLENIRLHYPHIGIILLLIASRDEDIEMLRKLANKGKGGMAVFLKQSLDQLDQLMEIIRAVSRGQIVLDPTLANLIFGNKTVSPFLDSLTAKEMEIMNLLAKGFTNSSIAGRLFVGEKTVEHHLNNIYGKLKVNSEADNRHQRVMAARLYLQETGELASNQFFNEAS